MGQSGGSFRKATCKAGGANGFLAAGGIDFFEEIASEPFKAPVRSF